LSGQQQTSNAAAWRQAIVPVTPDGASMIIVRFHYTRGTSFTGDTAIDDITIGAESAAAVYEANSVEASMTVNGVVGSACTPTVINVPFNSGATATVNLSTNQVGGVLGGHWEIGVQPGPMIPGLPLGNGELINVDYMAPNFFWVNGGQAGADFFAMPGTQLPGATGGSMTASFILDTLCPINYTLQGVIVGNEAVAPLSVYLTQATQIAIAPTATRLFLGDDANFNYALTGPAVNFYGSPFPNIFVCSNGRVAFGAGDNDFSPTLTEAINNVAFAGCWTDLEPNAGGCISVFEDGLGEVSVAYEGVRNWGTSEFTTFVVTIKASGEIVLSNMDNVAAYANNSFVGISQGNGFATNGGAVDYTFGIGATFNSTDMIYNFVNFGLGSPAPGITSISFTPNPFTNYDWTSL
ncbi:MAG TPA: hypothetical protein PKA37_10120, partial [Planctomycetota bacterium]|nr:hypothetical protein [Planctomycetota bacterium]